jgi:hypothetical protein
MQEDKVTLAQGNATFQTHQDTAGSHMESISCGHELNMVRLFSHALHKAAAEVFGFHGKVNHPGNKGHEEVCPTLNLGTGDKANEHHDQVRCVFVTHARHQLSNSHQILNTCSILYALLISSFVLLHNAIIGQNICIALS